MKINVQRIEDVGFPVHVEIDGKKTSTIIHLNDICPRCGKSNLILLTEKSKISGCNGCLSLFNYPELTPYQL